MAELTPQEALLEAVDTLLETAPCDCSHKRRYEDGEHLSRCYLFDLNIARGRMPTAGVQVLGPTEQYVSPADAARITWEDRHDTMPNEVWALVAQAVLDAAGVAPTRGGEQQDDDLTPEQEGFCARNCCWSGHHRDCPRHNPPVEGEQR